MLTSGDRLGAEKKNQQRFQFIPYAKLVYSPNTMPEFEDRSYALERRLAVLSFERTFKDDKDVNLLDKLTTQDELSGKSLHKMQELKRLAYKHHPYPDVAIRLITKSSLNGDNTLLDEWLERYRDIDAANIRR
jgi:hypothetical protein